MAQARLLPEARDDLREIATYIAVQDARPETAEKMIDAILDKCDLIATQPFMGTPRPDLGEGYRLSPIKRWVIVFRPTDEGIEVMRIVDGARDFKKLFGP
jgi:toxin ParE1/3/4